MRELIQTGLMDEIVWKAHEMTEQALWVSLVGLLGTMPSPKEVRLHGQVVRIAEGTDHYEEFRWKTKPLFQRRVKFDSNFCTIEIKPL